MGASFKHDKLWDCVGVQTLVNKSLWILSTNHNYSFSIQTITEIQHCNTESLSPLWFDFYPWLNFFYHTLPYIPKLEKKEKQNKQWITWNHNTPILPIA